MVKPDRPQMSVLLLHFACWVTKGTNTPLEYLILIAFPLQQRLHETASMLRYPYIVCLVNILLCRSEGQEYLYIVKRRKAGRIGHTLRRNCLLKHVNEGKTEGRLEMTGRRGRRRKQLLDDLKGKVDAGNRKRERKIALYGELALEWLCTYRKTDY